VIEQVDAITIPMKGRMIHAEGSSELTLQPYGTHPHEVIHSISRGDLNAILLDAAEATGRVRIEFEQRLERVDFARSTLTLTGPDGDTHEQPFRVVFGTDGAGSVVREAILEAEGAEDIAELGHGYKELTLPPADDGGFRLDPNALHIWPRGEFMLIALANPEGDFTVTLFAPNEGPAGFGGLTSAAEVRAFFTREFPDFTAMMPDLEDRFLDNPTGRLATLRTTGWSHRDQAVVLGDAAHAIVPFHGQGMNLAMESARSLARHLDDRPDDFRAAFTAFERERKPNSDAIADMALDNYLEMRSGVVDPGYVIRRELALELERRHPDRWSPRYNMVMFSTMPYADVQTRAARQADILAELTGEAATLTAVDYDLAASLIAELEPLPDLDPMARPDALSVN
jgi:kynurenine 3-monooxygenase